MKKLFLALSVFALLAGACNKDSQPVPSPSPSPSTQNQNNGGGQDYIPSPQQAAQDDTNGTVWKSTLEKSDNSARGNLMIRIDNHKIYLSTGRDFSSLIGKQVNVHYQGTMDSFTLVNITEQ